MFVSRLKTKNLSRSVHTTVSSKFEDPRSSKYYAGDIFEDEIQDTIKHKKRGPTKFDWMRINEMDVEDLPEMPDLDSYRKEDQYWKKLEAEDFFPAEAEQTYKVDENDTNDSELPYTMLTDIPLPETSYPAHLSPAQANLRRQRHLENFELYEKMPKASVVLNGFIDMRRDGFFPHREYYCLLIPCLLTFSDHQAIDILLAEMKALGYEWDEKVYSTMITQAIIFDDPTLLEQRWKHMLDAKYEPSVQICCQRLMYYARYGTDVDLVVRVFNETLAMGHTDPLIGSVMLAFCRDKELFELAETVFQRISDLNVLRKKYEGDVQTFEVEGMKYDHNPAAASARVIYEIMADITARQVMVERTESYLESAKYLYNTYVKTENDEPYMPNTSTLEQVVYMYFQAKLFGTGLEMIARIEKKGNKFPFTFYKNVMIKLTEFDCAQHFKEIQIEFDNWGFQYDGDIYSAMMRMFHRLKDYRKVKCTWDDMILIGGKPAIDSYTILISVYNEVGFPEDVQRFYEQQIKTNHKFERRFHEVMFHNFLKRGYPGSARTVAMARMIGDGFNLTLEELSALITKYAELGGGQQALSLLEKEFEELGYQVDAEILSTVIYGFSVKLSQENVDQARRTWSKFNSQVVLTYASAERLIRSFGVMREPALALQVYNRVRRDYQFQSTDEPTLFAAILGVPKSTTATIEQRLEVMAHMRKYKIPMDLHAYLAAIHLCEEYGSAKYALSVIKQFIIDYKGIPFHRGLFIDFFTVLVRFDSSQYRDLAMVWLKRIVPKEQHSNFMDSIRIPGTVSLDALRNSVMSLTQSSAVRDFIDSIDDSKFTPLAAEAGDEYKELFEGGDVDIEDLLVTKYGQERAADIQRAIGVDPEYVRTREKLEELNKQRKKALLEYENRKVTPSASSSEGEDEPALEPIEKTDRLNRE